jgi:hypothetical protein
LFDLWDISLSTSFVQVLKLGYAAERVFFRILLNFAILGGPFWLVLNLFFNFLTDPGIFVGMGQRFSLALSYGFGIAIVIFGRVCRSVRASSLRMNIFAMVPRTLGIYGADEFYAGS